MIKAYIELFKAGYILSFESYLDKELVGGGYGVVINKIFCGESMFSLVSNASKVAFVKLVERLKEDNFILIDCQIETPLLKSFGARNINRKDFLEILKQNKGF